MVVRKWQNRHQNNKIHVNRSYFYIWVVSSRLWNFLGNCQNDTSTQAGILKAGKYLESKNGKYQLDFQNSGLHLSCGSTTVKSNLKKNLINIAYLLLCLLFYNLYYSRFSQIRCIHFFLFAVPEIIKCGITQ